MCFSTRRWLSRIELILSKMNKYLFSYNNWFSVLYTAQIVHIKTSISSKNRTFRSQSLNNVLTCQCILGIAGDIAGKDMKRQYPSFMPTTHS